MAMFAQYAMASADEALNDAGWFPKKAEDLEATVSEILCRAVLFANGRRESISDLVLAAWMMLMIPL